MLLRSIQLSFVLASCGVLGLTAPPAVQDGGRDTIRGAQQAHDRQPPARGQTDRRFDTRREGVWGDRRFRRPLTAEQRQQIIEVVADLRPLSDADRKKLFELDPERFRGFFMNQGGQILMLARMRESQPELYDLKVKDLKSMRYSHAIARKLHEARAAGGGEAAEAAERELHEAVTAQFELDLQIREQEIILLEQQLERKRAELEHRRTNREEGIRRRMAQMIDRAAAHDGPAWRDRSGEARREHRDTSSGGGG